MHEIMNIAQVRKLSKYTMFFLMNVVLKDDDMHSVETRFHDRGFLKGRMMWLCMCE